MMPRKRDYPEIEVEKFYPKDEEEFTYFLKIPFDAIKNISISIANRNLVNLGSGLIRHLMDESGNVKYPNGVRIVDGKIINDSSAKRIFHWDYEKHLQNLGIKDKDGHVIAPAYMNGWRDLGQNPWHVFWSNNTAEGEYIDGEVISHGKKADKMVRLAEDERYGITRNEDSATGRIYTCLVMPKAGRPHIRRLRFDEQHEVRTPDLESRLSDAIEWCASGKPLIRAGQTIDIYEIVEQYYDVAHVFPVSGNSPEEIDGRTDRIRKGELVQRLYKNYPAKFRQNCVDALKEGLGTGTYYFDVLGVDNTSLMILQMYGTLADVARHGISKGMRDAIIIDEGGSIGTWSWYHGPNGGLENCSSYLRTQAIAMMGIKLKELEGQ